MTNELEEALFLDRARLIAIDHPADVEVHPEEGLQGDAATRSDSTRSATRRRRCAAIDDHGHDVLDRVARLDRRYSDDFALERDPRIRGAAPPDADAARDGRETPSAPPDRLDRLRVLERQLRRAPGEACSSVLRRSK